LRYFLVVVFAFSVAGYVVHFETRLASIERQLMSPGILYHEHYSAPLPGTTAPVKRVVETKRNDGETVDAWIARHNAAVAQSLADFPPV
jgi:hypothetical protein